MFETWKCRLFQIHKIHANCISITKYKLLLLSKQNTKFKIHEMYFNYVFQLLVFQLLYNTAEVSGWFVPKITKLCLHLVKLCRENCWLLFSWHGVYSKISKSAKHNFGRFKLSRDSFVCLLSVWQCEQLPTTLNERAEPHAILLLPIFPQSRM